MKLPCFIMVSATMQSHNPNGPHYNRLTTKGPWPFHCAWYGGHISNFVRWSERQCSSVSNQRLLAHSQYLPLSQYYRINLICIKYRTHNPSQTRCSGTLCIGQNSCALVPIVLHVHASMHIKSNLIWNEKTVSTWEQAWHHELTEDVIHKNCWIP
jgi:hypothetical protein